MIDARSDVESASFNGDSDRLADAPLTIIRPLRGWRSLGLRDLWVYRELFYFLMWRDLKVRYKQTVLGAVWAVLQPLVAMVVFTIFFGHLAHIESQGAPYAVFVLAGLVPWTLFSSALTQASMSVETNQALVTKIYFPRLVIPIGSTLANVVDFLLSCVVLAAVMAYYRVVPTVWVVILPLLFLLTMASALAAGVWLAALNARYRDIKYTIPFVVQVWFFLTPIVYSVNLLPARFTVIYGLNPMVGVVQGFRWALIGQANHVGPLLVLSCGIVLAMLVSGLAYFRRTETIFADVV